MADKIVKMHFSQALMNEAVQHYLQTVVVAKPIKVTKVETEGRERKINQVDHFDVTFEFPESSQ